MHINIAARVVVGLLAKMALVLVVLSLCGQFAKLALRLEWLGSAIRFFDLNRERNLPTWYQGLTLLLCAVLLWSIAGVRKRAAAPYVAYWRGLALIFVYLFCDEVFKWHERTVEPLRRWLDLGGFFLYAWVVPAALLVVLVGLLYIRFLLHLPKPTRRLFILAGALYVAGAMGMEMIGGKIHSQGGYGTMRYAAIATIEEVLEMTAVIVFVYALLTYANEHLAEPLRIAGRRITFRDEDRRAAAEVSAVLTKCDNPLDTAGR